MLPGVRPNIWGLSAAKEPVFAAYFLNGDKPGFVQHVPFLYIHQSVGCSQIDRHVRRIKARSFATLFSLQFFLRSILFLYHYLICTTFYIAFNIVLLKEKAAAVTTVEVISAPACCETR